jgi:hypothetical protein
VKIDASTWRAMKNRDLMSELLWSDWIKVELITGKLNLIPADFYLVCVTSTHQNFLKTGLSHRTMKSISV